MITAKSFRESLQPLPKAKPGTFISEVKDVKDPEGYTPGHAIEIDYELTDKAGKKFFHKEIFHIEYPSSRTYEFNEYLDELGCDTYQDFIGVNEEVTLEKQVTNKGVYTNIVKRKPLYEEGDNDGGTA